MPTSRTKQPPETPALGHGKGPSKGSAPEGGGSAAPLPDARLTRTWSTEETARQVALVEGLLTNGIRSELTIRDALRKQGHAAGRGRVRQLMQRVRDRWAQEESQARLSNKSEQVRRLHGYIRKAANPPETVNAKGERVPGRINHQAIGVYENLLADLLGTREPVQLSVNVRYTEAIAGVVADLSTEVAEQWLAELDMMERAALKARELGIIDVEGVEVSDSPVLPVAGGRR